VLLLLVLHHLLLDALLHGLLHLLHHHWILLLVGHHLLHHLLLWVHHAWLLLLLRCSEHVYRVGGLLLLLHHTGLLLRLCWLRVATHHIKQIDYRSLCLAGSLSLRSLLWCSSYLSRVYMTRSEHRLLHVFAWHELLGFSSLLNGSVPFKSLVEIIIDNQTHRHDTFVINLSNHIDQLGL